MATTPDTLVYRIDAIEVDAKQACIRRDGRELHLKPKSFRILIHLLTHRDRLVTKEELMEIFWKDTAVTDDALTQCIAELRRALGDTPRSPTYLKTVPRMGFRFVGRSALPMKRRSLSLNRPKLNSRLVCLNSRRLLQTH